MAGLSLLRDVYVHREAEARAHHARGMKVIGYVSNNVPTELIVAAGAVPFQLSGKPDEATPIADQYMEDFFDGYIRSLFNRALCGEFDFLDLLILPRTSESTLQLYYFLQAIPRWEPGVRLPEVILFDLLQTNNWLTGRYVRGRLDALKATLERVTQKPIHIPALSEAVCKMNRNRALIMQVNALRRQRPARLSGSDMLRVMASSTFIDTDSHCRQLQRILAESHDLAPLTGRRLMVKGSPLDNAAFYELVESCGAVVVADDHAWGERHYHHAVRDDADVMEALTEHFHLYSPSPRQYPQARQDELFIALLDEASVEGVIFYIEEHDDTLGWDYPPQKALLEQRGIRSLFLPYQSYREPDVAAQRAAIMGFLESFAGSAP